MTVSLSSFDASAPVAGWPVSLIAKFPSAASFALVSVRCAFHITVLNDRGRGFESHPCRHVADSKATSWLNVLSQLIPIVGRVFDSPCLRDSRGRLSVKLSLAATMS